LKKSHFFLSVVFPCFQVRNFDFRNTKKSTEKSDSLTEKKYGFRTFRFRIVQIPLISHNLKSEVGFAIGFEFETENDIKRVYT
jgi:hypothetical protein